MTQHTNAALRERPWIGKALLGLFSVMLTILSVQAIGQYQLYQQQREDMNARINYQNAQIEALKNRQDLMFKRQEGVELYNRDQDVRMAKEFVSLERYTCDIKDLKETVKDGFTSIHKQIELFHSREAKR